MEKLTFPEGSLRPRWYDDEPTSDLGLTDVAEIELDHKGYQFNLIGVWRDKEGRLWWGCDSGCSCPSPWARVAELDRLFNFDPLRDALYEARGVVLSEAAAFETAVRSALDALKG